MGENETHRAPGRTVDALPLKLLAAVWLPFSCGYFLSYAFRTINAIISQDLVQDLGIAPGQLGLLTAAYFFTFALVQIPLGVMLDRFGPRRIETVLLLFAAAGAVLFSIANGIELLVLARALIGVGVSACLMAALKAFVQWFPMSRIASLNGWLLACGGLGAFATSLPAEAALHYTDWRGLFAGIAARCRIHLFRRAGPARRRGEGRLARTSRRRANGIQLGRVLARKSCVHGRTGNIHVGADPVDLALAEGCRRL